MRFQKTASIIKSVCFSLCISLGFTLAASVSAKAETQPVEYRNQRTSFHYSSFTSAYSCTYATTLAEEMLWRMGARKILVSCSGGLPFSQFLLLRMEFDTAQVSTSPTAETGSWEQVKIWDWDRACDLNVRLFRSILPYFTSRNVRISNGCWDSRGNFDFEAEILR